MKAQLIYPMALYVFYVWCLAVYLFTTRVRAIRTGGVSAKYFKSYQGASPPDRVILVGRHYDNQFQVPLLFFLACVLHISLGSVNSSTLVFAWAFVFSRAFHAWIHLGRNKLQKRVLAFALGWLMVLALWAQLVYAALA